MYPTIFPPIIPTNRRGKKLNQDIRTIVLHSRSILQRCWQISETHCRCIRLRNTVRNFLFRDELSSTFFQSRRRRDLPRDIYPRIRVTKNKEDSLANTLFNCFRRSNAREEWFFVGSPPIAGFRGRDRQIDWKRKRIYRGCPVRCRLSFLAPPLFPSGSSLGLFGPPFSSGPVEVPLSQVPGRYRVYSERGRAVRRGPTSSSNVPGYWISSMAGYVRTSLFRRSTDEKCHSGFVGGETHEANDGDERGRGNLWWVRPTILLAAAASGSSEPNSLGGGGTGEILSGTQEPSVDGT